MAFRLQITSMKLCKRLICLSASAILLAASIAAAVDFEHLARVMNLRFGEAGSQTLSDWRSLLNDAGQLGTPEKLRRVNEFFNRRVRFGDDQQIWGQSDYWATPLETLGKKAGDCEDFTIAKYFTLLSLNVPNEQLRLIYVKAHIGGTNSGISQAHMVLAYYRPQMQTLWFSIILLRKFARQGVVPTWCRFSVLTARVSGRALQRAALRAGESAGFLAGRICCNAPMRRVLMDEMAVEAVLRSIFSLCLIAV